MIKSFRKLWELLTTTQRRGAIVMLAIMLISMMLEMIGIGMIIPVLALMTENELIERYPVLTHFIQGLGNPTKEQLVFVGMLIMVSLYVTKVLFLAFLAWRQNRFVFGVQANLSLRLFVGYLRQPYTFHLQRNSAQLIQNALNETQLLTLTGLSSALTLLTELFVLLGILALLLIVEPIGAFVVLSVLGLAGWGFHQITRKPILRWGKERQLHERLRIQNLQQGLGSAKDLKLLGREAEFIRRYGLHNDLSAKAGQGARTMLQFPRLWIELLAVIGLASLVFVMIGQGKPLDALLPTLGLFSMAMFRIMPSGSRILATIQGLRYALPVIDTLHSELVLMDGAEAPQHGPPLSFRSSLTLDHVSFHYPSSDAPALTKVSLSIPRNASVGFVGGSGAGKSTLVDIILGLLTPDSGTVWVDNIDIQTNLRGWQDQIGYVPQSIYLTDDTMRRNIAFGLPDEQIDESAVWRSLRDAQLEQFVRELPKGLDTLMGERGIRLSGGQRQRIGIARALYHDPPVLVLDEATSSLDFSTERGLMEAVFALHSQKTIIIVAHRLSTIEQCEWVYRIENGHVVESGKTGEVLGRAVMRAS